MVFYDNFSIFSTHVLQLTHPSYAFSSSSSIVLTSILTNAIVNLRPPLTKPLIYQIIFFWNTLSSYPLEQIHNYWSIPGFIHPFLYPCQIYIHFSFKFLTVNNFCITYASISKTFVFKTDPLSVTDMYSTVFYISIWIFKKPHESLIH